MKIKPYNRISFRFYLFVTSIIVASVAITGWRFSNFFLMYLDHNFRKNSIDSAEIVGLKLSSEIRDIERSVRYFMQLDRQLTPAALNSLYKSLQLENVYIKDLLVVSNDNNNRRSILFNSDQEGHNLAKFEKIRSENPASADSHNLEIYPDGDNLILIKSFFMDQSNASIQHILLIENDILAPFVGVEAGRAVRVFNHDLTDLAKQESQFDLAQIFSSSDSKWGYLLRGGIGSGFLNSIHARDGTEWVGAYYRDPKYGFMIVVLHKADSIAGSFASIIWEIADWVILVLLVALALVFMLTRPIIANIELLVHSTQNIALGKFQNIPEVKSRDEVGYLAAGIKWMAGQIAGLLDSERQKILYEKELQTANTVQNTFFKQPHIHSDPFVLVSYYRPASECGGDWWGHFSIKKDVDLVLMGDATGHGVPAALVTAIAFTTCNILADNIRKGEIDYKKPSAILTELNRILYSCLEGQFCLTFIAMVFDATEGKVYYSNGGHTFPILIPASETDERLGKRKKNSPPVTRLTRERGQDTSILGVNKDTVFHDNETTLKVGDKVVIYTDGLTEATNAEGKQWGSRKLINTIDKAKNQGIEEMLKQMLDDFFKFSWSSEHFEDDITIMIVEYSNVLTNGNDN